MGRLFSFPVTTKRRFLQRECVPSRFLEISVYLEFWLAIVPGKWCQPKRPPSTRNLRRGRL